MKKITALATYLKTDKKQIEVDGTTFRHDGTTQYEVLTRKELRARELETFESCYYLEHLNGMQKGLELQLSGELHKSYGHINKDVEISEYHKKLATRIMNSFIVSPKKAFKQSGFFEESINQYQKVDKFYIVAI